MLMVGGLAACCADEPGGEGGGDGGIASDGGGMQEERSLRSRRTLAFRCDAGLDGGVSECGGGVVVIGFGVLPEVVDEGGCGWQTVQKACRLEG